MFNKYYFVFDRFYKVWISSQTYNRKFIVAPLADNSTRWHFLCVFSDRCCIYETYNYEEAKKLKLEMFVK